MWPLENRMAKHAVIVLANRVMEVRNCKDNCFSGVVREMTLPLIIGFKLFVLDNPN